MVKTPKEILKEYWGFDDFRLSQIPIVEDAIAGKDVLALLPTGGGEIHLFSGAGTLYPKVNLGYFSLNCTYG